MQSLTITELKTRDSHYNNYPLLQEEMQEHAKELIKQSKLLAPFDADTLAESIQYSLWYSQGDGVSFRKWQYTKTLTYWKTQKDILFFVATNSYARHYSHEKTFYIDWQLQSYFLNWLTKKEEEKMQELADEYTEELRSICSKLEKRWYKIIEEEDEISIISNAFDRWKEANKIEDASDLWDFEYSTKPTEWYTQIATSGDTNIDGLWVQLPPLEEHIKETNYFTFA